MLYYGSIMCTHLGALCLQYKYMLHHDHQEYLQGREFLSFYLYLVKIVPTSVITRQVFPFATESLAVRDRLIKVISQRESSTCLACPLDLYARPW